MSNVIANGENVFNYFLHLPSETRMEIVDAMQADDRCRFTRCSKLSNKEAKASKNFLFGLAIFAYERKVDIHVCYYDDIEYTLNYTTFVEKGVECTTMDGKIVWREDLDSSTDIVLCAAEKFKELLGMYQRKIQSLYFIGSSFKNKLKDFDFGIERLTVLKHLCLHQDSDPKQFFTKIQRPLKYLYVHHSRDINIHLADFVQIHQVRNRLHIPHLKLNAEQFQALSASDVNIHIGHLTVNDIYRFVTSWQNGTIRKKVRNYLWRELQSSHFDSLMLFRLLGMQFDDTQVSMMPEKVDMKIKHNKEAGKSARLSYFGKHTGILVFVVGGYVVP